MLIALLYREPGEIAAAAPACDVVPLGDTYWREFHAAPLPTGSIFETAIVEIADAALQKRVMSVGIDDAVCGRELDQVIQAIVVPARDLRKRAA